MALPLVKNVGSMILQSASLYLQRVSVPRAKVNGIKPRQQGKPPVANSSEAPFDPRGAGTVYTEVLNIQSPVKLFMA